MLQHHLTRLLHQVVHIIRRHAFRRDGLQHPDLQLAAGEGSLRRVVDVAVPRRHNRQHGQLCLDRQVEGSLLERQQVGCV